MSKKTYKVLNMDCASCATLIELDLEDAGIAAKCNYATETLEVEKDADEKRVREIVKKLGYDLAI